MRKITAIASAALMTGLSMGVAAADLSSLTDTFINASGEFDAYVVLGTQGGTNVAGFANDVAGSVVVAAAFAQQAKTVTGASGSATLSRNQSTSYLNGSFTGFDGSVPTSGVTKTWKNGDSGFSWLANQTVQNSSGHDVANATSFLEVEQYAVKLTKNGEYTLFGDKITYNLTFNNKNTLTSGNKAVGNHTRNIPFPDGKNYQITNWTYASTGTDGINVTLGDFTTVQSTIGSEYPIGTTGAKFEIIDYSTSPTNQLQVKVTGLDGTVLFNNFVSEGDEIYSDDDFTLNLAEYHVTGGGVVDADIDWTTSSVKLQQNRENSAWPDWKIKMTVDSTPTGITSIAWIYTPDDPVTLEAGSELSMFDDFFSVKAGAFEINSTDGEEAAFSVYSATDSTQDLTFVDNETNTHRIDLNMQSGTFGAGSNLTTVTSWIDSYTFTLTCNSQGETGSPTEKTTNVTIDRGSDYENITVFNGSPFYLNNSFGGVNVTHWLVKANLTWAHENNPCEEASFNLTILNASSVAGNPINGSLNYLLGGSATKVGWANVSSSSVNGTVTLSEPNSESVTVTIENGVIESINDGAGDVLTADGTRYTKYGSKMVKDGTTLTVYFPEAARHGSVTVGQDDKTLYELSDNEYNEELDVTLESGAGESVTVNNIDVGLAMLDSELSASSINKPVILIGGWSVNTLVAGLRDDGLINTSNLAGANSALVQLVDNAFGSNSALAIIGYGGADTRMAAQVVASQVLGTDMGLSGSMTKLNTSLGSYNQVTVI